MSSKILEYKKRGRTEEENVRMFHRELGEYDAGMVVSQVSIRLKFGERYGATYRLRRPSDNCLIGAV